MRTSRPLIALMAATTAASLAAAPTLGDAADDLAVDACTTSLAHAAERIAPDATVAAPTEVAGLDVAVVTDPLIAPGIPNAVLRSGHTWCGVEAFNLVAGTELAGAGPAALARAFASVAGMNHLGDVTVDDVAVAGGEVTLTTAGGRHGAVSDWTVTVDARGIAAATFTTTHWDGTLADASVGGLEGVTSLPGHTRTWQRGADGLLHVDATVADDLAASWATRAEDVERAAVLGGNAPGDPLEHVGRDGYRIVLSYGLSPYTPDSGTDTGVAQADRLRSLHRGIVRNYTAFEDWGVVDPFDNAGRTYLGLDTSVGGEAGYVNVDSGLSAYCLACAVLTDGMEIHLAYLFPELAPELVGIDYEDREAFFNDVLSHEMVHSLQGGYSDGRGSAYSRSFIEGTARASEALTDTASNSYTTDTISYVDNANGCEGFENGHGGWIDAQADGPFAGHTYDACYFWWTYYAAHGGEGLVALLETLNPVLDDRDGDENAVELNLRSLQAASPTGDGLADLARWGGAFATGAGYDIVDAGGATHDWFALLASATRASDTSEPRDVTVRDAGVMAFTVTADGTVEELPTDAAAYVVGLTPAGDLDVEALTVGAAVTAGQVIAIVAPGTGAFSGTLHVSPDAT